MVHKYYILICSLTEHEVKKFLVKKKCIYDRRSSITLHDFAHVVIYKIYLPFAHEYLKHFTRIVKLVKINAKIPLRKFHITLLILIDNFIYEILNFIYEVSISYMK